MGNGGSERACTLSGDALFELVSKYRGHEWALAADPDAEAEGEGGGRFVLTMGASETEGDTDERSEGEVAGRRHRR